MSPDQSSPDGRRRESDTDSRLGGPVRQSGSPDAPEGGANRLFDLRYLIGALFTLFGVVLTIASFFVPHPESGDVDINLWLGLGMLILGVFFLLWARLRPLHVGGRSAAAEADLDR